MTGALGTACTGVALRRRPDHPLCPPRFRDAGRTLWITRLLPADIAVVPMASSLCFGRVRVAIQRDVVAAVPAEQRQPCRLPAAGACEDLRVAADPSL